MKKDRLAMTGICLFILAGMIYMALNDTGTENGKNQDKNEAYESGENAAADEVTDTVRGAEEDAFSKEETTEPDASADQEEEPEVSQTRAEEILFEDPEDIGEYQWVYDYADFSEAWDGDDEWNLPYVDDETFEMLRAAYEEVDFSGEFELGDPELYDEYRENTGGCCKITGRSWIKRLGG